MKLKLFLFVAMVFGLAIGTLVMGQAVDIIDDYRVADVTVEWTGIPLVIDMQNDSVVELGLRADKVCVWRRAE